MKQDVVDKLQIFVDKLDVDDSTLRTLKDLINDVIDYSYQSGWFNCQKEYEDEDNFS